ncbi:MAG: hypothetical protein JRJ84_24725, partial [Deltaproteobacteria bacterium]|nr:hypothetical protein [Deltaproteobacteria bacterium]
LEQPEAAEAYFRQALTLLSEDIDLGDAWKGVAVSLGQRDLCPEAMDAADRARALHPNLRLKLPECEDSHEPAAQETP